MAFCVRSHVWIALSSSTLEREVPGGWFGVMLLRWDLFLGKVVRARFVPLALQTLRSLSWATW